jgi:hypothetical protein
MRSDAIPEDVLPWLSLAWGAAGRLDATYGDTGCVGAFGFTYRAGTWTALGLVRLIQEEQAGPVRWLAGAPVPTAFIEAAQGGGTVEYVDGRWRLVGETPERTSGEDWPAAGMGTLRGVPLLFEAELHPATNQWDITPRRWDGSAWQPMRSVRLENPVPPQEVPLGIARPSLRERITSVSDGDTLAAAWEMCINRGDPEAARYEDCRAVVRVWNDGRVQDLSDLPVENRDHTEPVAIALSGSTLLAATLPRSAPGARAATRGVVVSRWDAAGHRWVPQGSPMAAPPGDDCRVVVDALAAEPARVIWSAACNRSGEWTSEVHAVVLRDGRWVSAIGTTPPPEAPERSSAPVVLAAVWDGEAPVLMTALYTARRVVVSRGSVAGWEPLGVLSTGR